MSYRLTWERLLSGDRPRRTSDQPASSGSPKSVSGDERTPFEVDYDRIVFSAPFRRLARKTQVHPLAKNDHIHNRLTHSIEVASIGRSFARKLSTLLKERCPNERVPDSHLAWIMQSASLVHDLGNPPFGHAGEEIIRVWAEDHVEEMFAPHRFENERQLTDAKSDWFHFEGNAQGFRLAARPDNPQVAYLRLTHATLAASIKYPWTAADERARKKRKHSVYCSEESIFRAMAEDLGLVREGGHVSRHPLSFLTEAADDICYRVIDLEDAVEMGIRNHLYVAELFCHIAGLPLADASQKGLPELRAAVIKSLIGKYWDVFVNDFDNIMNGVRDVDLKSSLDESTQLQMHQIKLEYETIFSHSKKVAMEFGAYHILGRILKALMKTVNNIHDCKSKSYEEIPFLSRRCAEMAWGGQFVRENLQRPHVWWLWRMQDFVSGMTDDFATSLSGEIDGHSLYSR
ncbi:dGTP triphosphohydrolase [Planctomicrobium sp. SH668]|uniref:dGTP triphosphohydrolase n=1 Tax=Planctomicrobium sp. SH668 TaxID=3448126 RepID=UPI003F5CABE1